MDRERREIPSAAHSHARYPCSSKGASLVSRARDRLTAAALKKKEPGLYPDGAGLYLQITVGSDGTPRRSWVYRFRLPSGKAREMGLGSVDDVSLAGARQKRSEARSLVLAGIDPIERRNAERAALAATQTPKQAEVMTFKRCAELYISSHEGTWKNPKHARQWPATLESYVYPVFGDVAVEDINQDLVMQVLDPIWRAKTETAARVRGRIETILDWARVRGYRSGENPARWRGHLERALPQRSKVQRVKHFEAVPVAQAPGVFQALARQDSVGSRALRFAILTASRSNETRGATWQEFDLENGVWIIPARRMKAGREHRVPLSNPALSLLEQQAEHGMVSEGHVFESLMRPGSPLSDQTLGKCLRRLGRSETVHGWRSTFRDWVADKTDFPREVAEAALAHSNADKVEAAYLRSSMFEKRRSLMDAWACFLTGAESGLDA
jgi:integrase